MKVLQINLHHSKAASAALLLHLSEKGEELILVQEPWVVKNRVCGLSSDAYQIVSAPVPGKIGACILIKKTISYNLLTHFSDEDTVSIDVEGKSTKLWLVSTYMAHDCQDCPPARLLDVVKEANLRKFPVVVGADANGHHLLQRRYFQ